MNKHTDLIFEYMNMKLAPSDAFCAFHSSLPTQYRSHTAIIQLGILTQQLYEYEYDLDIETDSGQSSFGEFDFTSQRDSESVKEFADKIKTSLETGDPLIINRHQFPSAVYTAVCDFLVQIETELSPERERLVRRYCDQTGLSGSSATEAEETASPTSTRTPSSSQTGGGIKAELTDVSKY